MFVDGEFILEKKDLHLPLRGSSNQRIIDLNASRDKGELVLFEDLMQSTQ
jgi:anaerobic ribonucleoside-triphosphate reductase activating protein